MADRIERIARTWAINTANTAVYIASFGERVLHEGRHASLRGIWSNWNRSFESQPASFETPETEAEICRIVKEATRLRAVGGGHTFNASPLTNGTMLSLDRYTKILSVDQATGRVRVQTGIRLRDLTAALLEHGLALAVQGSTDAQSIAGLLSTDIHGTGRDVGFLSSNVLSLRLVDADGRARTLHPRDEMFHAALGGLGACGVITEVEIQCERAYNLRKSVEIVKRDWVTKNIDAILEEHKHVSFYYVGGVFTESVRMNVWDRTVAPPTPLYRLHKMRLELTDMLVSGYALGLAKLLDLSDLVANLGLAFMWLTMNGHSTVYPAREGFPRKLFYRHDELEYGVPYDTHQACLDEVFAYLEEKRFLTIIEVRFTPNTSESLLGPGVGRRTCFIELAPSLSIDSTEVFADVEKILWKYGGQLHLGKATRAGAREMAAMYGERFTRFQRARREADPTGKFVNDFTARLFTGVATTEPSVTATSSAEHAAPIPGLQPITA
ncbi:D-arabinono-1,4-lactone oxidase [Polyangium sp. 15x6]|uniref:D-arabinono-1,4-lactone oxidase n=1 Tax=Polyangium sp. 15x6 TaxID=3042687 RepID=UPI00249A5EA6|nr:D-arabinono-1,4-lactone oxidase [Polyangium sp. 15x6]MDI3286206.1 D-arabinono-1,4-lactone oxidase [Polyangium sp. 15x6]